MNFFWRAVTIWALILILILAICVPSVDPPRLKMLALGVALGLVLYL